MNFEVRAAREGDAEKIAELIEGFRREKIMLARSADEIRAQVHWFQVAEDAIGIAGCVSLHVYHAGLAEVRSLAVRPDRQGQGVGRALVQAAVVLADREAIASLCALTLEPLFFERLGFQRVDKALLPEKIWKDCAGCAFLNDCREIALVRSLH